MEAIATMIQQIVSMIGGAILAFKTFIEAKKLLDKQVMPDINVGETAEEIKNKQHLAKYLVIFAGIEAAYNTAKALMLALYMVITLYYAFKLTDRVSRKPPDMPKA